MLVMLLLAGAAHAQVRSVTLQPLSKDFGYFPGDIVQGTAIIDVGPDTVLDRDSLPYAGPIATSLDLRAISVSDEAVPGGRHITVHAQYQTFATPDEVSRVDVPGYQVAFMQGRKRLVTNVPGFGFAVSPFRHDILGTVDIGVLRPDHPFATVDVSPSRFALLAGLVLTLLSLLCLGATRGWLAWARGGHAPFARVARSCAALAATGLRERRFCCCTAPSMKAPANACWPRMWINSSSGRHVLHRCEAT